MTRFHAVRPVALAAAVLAVGLAACGGSDSGPAGDSTATSTSMNPGLDCTQCHGFTLAGTVYGSATATPGAPGVTGAQVHVADASGTFTLVSDQQGSFYTNRALTPPVNVSLDLGGATASMSGLGFTRGSQIGCASCHGSAQPVIHVP